MLCIGHEKPSIVASVALFAVGECVGHTPIRVVHSERDTGGDSTVPRSEASMKAQANRTAAKSTVACTRPRRSVARPFCDCLRGWYCIGRRRGCPTENRIAPDESLAAAALSYGCPYSALAQGVGGILLSRNRFTCIFMGNPKSTDTNTSVEFGHRLPARVSSFETGPESQFFSDGRPLRHITQLGLSKATVPCPPGLGFMPWNLCSGN